MSYYRNIPLFESLCIIAWQVEEQPNYTSRVGAQGLTPRNRRPGKMPGFLVLTRHQASITTGASPMRLIIVEPPYTCSPRLIYLLQGSKVCWPRTPPVTLVCFMSRLWRHWNNGSVCRSPSTPSQHSNYKSDERRKSMSTSTTRSGQGIIYRNIEITTIQRLGISNNMVTPIIHSTRATAPTRGMYGGLNRSWRWIG